MIKVIFRIAFILAFSSCAPKPLAWIALGDSITYLNEHPDETGNRITKGYMSRVVDELPHIHYVNKGFNGWTAGDVAGKINDLDLQQADVYSVYLGTNDWWSGRPLGTIEDYKINSGNNTFYGSYRIIIDKLRALQPKARMVLMTPMQRVDFVYIGDMKNNAYGSYKKKNNQTLEEFAQAIISIRELEKFEVVDLYHKSGMTHDNLVKFKRLKDPATGEYRNYPYPDFIQIPFNPETDEYPYPPDATHMTYDGLHPSDEGYAIIADMLVEIMSD